MDKSSDTAKTKAEKFWQIKASSVTTDDPLLGCLVVLTRLEHKPFSPESLVAGLPLVEDKLTPDLFVRAAKRADLSAKIVFRPLNQITTLVLPVVLLLQNQQACILVGIKKGKIAQIIQPETGEGMREIKLEKLKSLYTGYSIFTRPTYKFDQRAEKSIKTQN